MITKDVRDIFGLMEMFQNRTVVMAAQVRKLSPRARVQPVKTSLSGRRLTAGRLNEQWVLGPDAQLGPPPNVGKLLGLAKPPPRLAAAPGHHRARRFWSQSLPSGSHNRLSPDLHAMYLSFLLSFLNATLEYMYLTCREPVLTP